MRYSFRLLAILGLWLVGSSAVVAQTRSESVDYTAYNNYYNGTNWVSYASGYGNVLGTNTSNGDFYIYTTGSAVSAGLARTLTQAAAVTAAGTVSSTSVQAYTGSFGNINATGTITGTTASVSNLYVNGSAVTGGGAHTRQRNFVTVSGTVNVPSWATEAEVWVVGGGGSGTNSPSSSTGGRAGSEAYVDWTFSAGSVATLTVTVGISGTDTNSGWDASGYTGGTTTVTGTPGTVTGNGGGGSGATLNVNTSSTFIIPGYGRGGTGWDGSNYAGSYGSSQGAALIYFY